MFYLLYHTTPYLKNIQIIIHYIYFVEEKKTNMSDLINMFIINTYNHIFVCNSYKTNEMFMPSSKKKPYTIMMVKNIL